MGIKQNQRTLPATARSPLNWFTTEWGFVSSVFFCIKSAMFHSATLWFMFTVVYGKVYQLVWRRKFVNNKSKLIWFDTPLFKNILFRLIVYSYKADAGFCSIRFRPIKWYVSFANLIKDVLSFTKLKTITRLCAYSCTEGWENSVKGQKQLLTVFICVKSMIKESGSIKTKIQDLIGVIQTQKKNIFNYRLRSIGQYVHF